MAASAFWLFNVAVLSLLETCKPYNHSNTTDEPHDHFNSTVCDPGSSSGGVVILTGAIIGNLAVYLIIFSCIFIRKKISSVRQLQQLTRLSSRDLTTQNNGTVNTRDVQCQTDSYASPPTFGSPAHPTCAASFKDMQGEHLKAASQRPPPPSYRSAARY